MTTQTRKAPPGCLWLPDAAEYLGYDISTLRKWRNVRKTGPASFKAGGKVVYRIAVLDAWLAEQEASDPHSNPALNDADAPVEVRAPRQPARAA